MTHVRLEFDCEKMQDIIEALSGNKVYEMLTTHKVKNLSLEISEANG